MPNCSFPYMPDFISLIRGKDVNELSRRLRKHYFLVNNDKKENTTFSRKKDRKDRKDEV